MTYKEPSFNSNSIKAFMGSYNDGVNIKKKTASQKTKKATVKKTKK